jgi:hypothetical protein
VTGETSVALFPTAADFEWWKAEAAAKNRRYLRLKIFPTREVRKKDLLGVERVKSSPDAPATEALLHLDTSGALRWVGTLRDMER